jgi:hypothetical protein
MIQSEQTTKIWYLLINGNQEGPFSFEDLKRDNRLTLDTLARKDDWKIWKPIREIPELIKVLPKKKQPSQNSPDEEWSPDQVEGPQEEMVLDFGSEPPYLPWIIIALICLMYVIMELYG